MCSVLFHVVQYDMSLGDLVLVLSRNRRVLREGGRDDHFILNCIDFHFIITLIPYTALTELYFNLSTFIFINCNITRISSSE